MTRSEADVRYIFATIVIVCFLSLMLANSDDRVEHWPGFQTPVGAGVDVANQETTPTDNGDYLERFVVSIPGDFVHAPSIATLANGDLFAAWFSGTREGAADVQIFASRLPSGQSQWSGAVAIADRVSTANGVRRVIRKLGNPAIIQDGRGRLIVFYVSVSLGGWAGSAINWIASEDNGKTWSKPVRLHNTAFANISTLVRSGPVLHASGMIGLPVYQEFLGKFPEYLLLNPDLKILTKTRFASGRESLQPSVAIRSHESAAAFMRYAGDPPSKTLVSLTQNSGATWSPPIGLPIPNPNSSVSAIASGLGDWPWLVLGNDSEDGRFRLSLYAVSQDLSRVDRLRVLDASPSLKGELIPIEVFKPYLLKSLIDSGHPMPETVVDVLLKRMCRDERNCDADYEYPNIVRDKTGRFHVIYAYNDLLIKHVSFDSLWLRNAIKHAVKE